ncbi:transcription factor TFIIH complex subunit Tfb5-domain-containing protein [Aspergillus minisclerotigenes]|uniref:General transcription and DNA repair factor IIH subunit TFB5 n=1 Tax=Aspergillus minisclerotigenes TaxID=656917 RepID=A0A5N6IKD9_9EURO|nr:transcription factor TFIIH complex subunit Tfb5-domain-containing protein [Aspergillus minisclerotigenes]
MTKCPDIRLCDVAAGDLPFSSNGCSKIYISPHAGPLYFAGVLIECDPSVKAIILKYDEERHDYIVEDLDDDRHLVIKESQLQNLKIRLGRELDEKVMQPDESESDE